MAFTPQQDAFILMAHFRSGTQNADGSWIYSLQSCIQQFEQAFPDADVDYDNFVNRRHHILQRFNTKHCICKSKSTGRVTILDEGTVDNIQARMQQSPNKSIRKLSTQTGLSYGTCQKALKKNLHLYPYKVSVVHEILPRDFQARIQFCRWFNENLNDNILNLTFMSDEAWFFLSGFINSQNYRTWAADNPHTIVDTSLHPEKVGVWVAMSRRRIYGPVFFEDTINGERYRNNLLQPFIEQLMDDELQEGYFQQDGATAHTAQETITYLQQFFDNRLISRGRWPARSPDLTPLDYFLFGHLKNCVYRNHPQIDELKQAIENEINNITPAILINVFENLKKRVRLCLEKNGEHFEQFL